MYICKWQRKNARIKPPRKTVIDEVQKEYDEMIVTQLEMFEQFYKAEDYHQNYYNTNPDGGYCQAVINPKLNKIKHLYQEKLKEE